MKTESTKMKVIFTPDDEPYLGNTSLLAFDRLIVVCLKINGQIAPQTHKLEKDDLQWAACQLIPAGVSIALSIRELVRQGYLYGAFVLLRPLAERAITILYLHRFPDKVAIWTSGWEHKKRPTLAKMINDIGGSQFPDIGRDVTKSLNSLTHGDPDSAAWHLVAMGDGSFGHATSKILDRPDLCDKVSTETATWMSVLLAMMVAIFPEAAKSAN